MRDPENAAELRVLANKIISAFNANSRDMIETHAAREDCSYMKDDLRCLWETYFSSGRVYESDKDVLSALRMFPYKYWPQDIYLEASLAMSEMLQCPVAAQVEPTRMNAQSRYLLDYLDDDTSQTGENGVIRHIFEIMGTKNTWCVEFGAWDGRRYSNTYELVAQGGWHGVLIEGKQSRFDALVENYKGNERAHLFNQMIGFDSQSDSIDFVLGQTGIPGDFDLMIVDIDGNDWHVWKSMQAYKPRLVVIELNPTIPNDVLYIQERNAEQQRGCSLRALIALGRLKGYELVCATSLNAFFVVAEEYEKFDIADNSIDAMYTPIMDGRIFHGYDSSIHVVGMPMMMWDWRGLGQAWEQDMPDRVNVYL